MTYATEKQVAMETIDDRDIHAVRMEECTLVDTQWFCRWQGILYGEQHHMWQSQVDNEHYSTVSDLIRLVISLECFIEITPDFLRPFMND